MVKEKHWRLSKLWALTFPVTFVSAVVYNIIYFAYLEFDQEICLKCKILKKKSECALVDKLSVELGAIFWDNKL